LAVISLTALTIRDLDAQNKRTVGLAGPRYSPGQDAASPNIRIDYLDSTLDCLMQGNALRDRVMEARKQFSVDLRGIQAPTHQIFARRLSPKDLLSRLETLGEAVSPHAIRAAFLSVDRASRSLLTAVERASDAVRTELDGLPDRGTDNEAEVRRRTLYARESQLASLRQAIYPISHLTEGVNGRLLRDRNALLLLGSWGMGKTHFLCDLAVAETRGGRPALVVLATQLDSSQQILDTVATATRLADDGEQLLGALDDLGRAAHCRALLLIDAINEGDRDAWRRQLRSLLASVARFENVALVLSCRDPFQALILGGSQAPRLEQVWHHGFDEGEVNAQLTFFSFYGIEAPETPLLVTEFSRPLFLRLLCQSISNLSRRSQKKKLREVAAGQKGLRYVIEHFARELGGPIEKDFGLASKSIWSVMKSEGEDGISGLMADDGTDWLWRDRVVALLEARFNQTNAQAQRLVSRIVHDGLLIEVPRWQDGVLVEGIAFAFQRFSDALIANHLIPGDLSRLSETTIRRLLYANRPLGRVFASNERWEEYDQPGLASAIMLEWPERLKKSSLPRELTSYLPRRARYIGPLATAFLDGLPWRDSSSFTDETNGVISFLLDRPSAPEWGETVEVLFGLATRPGHPCSAGLLWEYLEDDTVANRDLTWSEFVRQADEGSSVRRLLAWMEMREPTSSPNPDLLRLLALLLTTTDRTLRDRATRQLVAQSSSDPGPLFNLALHSLDFNDPYVRERLLAASYGVLMQKWAAADASLRERTVLFARQLVERMFMPSSDAGTKHALSRGYAQGIVQLAQRMSPGCIATQRVRYTREPFPGTTSVFRSGQAIGDDAVADAMANLRHSDFLNYTIGRLVRDRGNYDFAHGEFTRVCRQIARRMQDLGYSSSAFDAVDKRIAEVASWRTRRGDAHQVDRYAKKYAWIALFEMYGLREDQGRLKHDYYEESRPSDCDIDPSFPGDIESWDTWSAEVLPRRDIFPPNQRSLVQWIRKGPALRVERILHREALPGLAAEDWLLLDAHLGANGSYDRRFWAEVRTVLIQADKLKDFLHRVSPWDFFGGFREPPSDYYTYAGEVSWSHRFGQELRDANGNPRPCEEIVQSSATDGFGAVVQIPVRGWHWEAHHSATNVGLSVTYPAPHLCMYLKLENRGQTCNLFAPDGSQATVYADAAGSGLYRQSWLFIRKKELDRYLLDHGLGMIWLWRGEREASHRKLRNRDHWGTRVGEALRSDEARFGGGLVYKP
jgi:hypothetical protein